MTLKVQSLLVACAAVLAGCGGSQSSGTSAAASTAVGTPAETTSTTLQLDVPASETANLGAQPTFHVAPVLLDEPDDMDAAVSDTSASFGAHVTQVPAALAALSTRRLTREDIEAAAQGTPTLRSQIEEEDRDATPLASGTAVATYTPAQIRAAYAMPALPANGATLTATQAAQLGAGQTIYLVDAMNNPNVAAELAAFDSKFGLPTCTVTAIATNATLPLATAPGNGCVLSVVYSTTSGGITASAPAYDSGWSTEISLDVQWAHATAPLARIVLIEAPDSSTTSLVAAVNLANSMGHGVVSMSFGAAEGGWTAIVGQRIYRGEHVLCGLGRGQRRGGQLACRVLACAGGRRHHAHVQQRRTQRSRVVEQRWRREQLYRPPHLSGKHRARHGNTHRTQRLGRFFQRGPDHRPIHCGDLLRAARRWAG
jgi:hypothetical protein